jgi:hypothetical protein
VGEGKGRSEKGKSKKDLTLFIKKIIDNIKVKKKSISNTKRP